MKQREITCQDCGTTWMRPVQTGQIPKRCPDCHREAKRQRERDRREADRRPSGERTCVGCGEPFPLNSKGKTRKWCSESCRAWHKRHPGEAKPPRQTACQRCGTSIADKNRAAKFCSTECGEYARGQRKETTERTCPVCRRTFAASNNQRFCPPEPGKTRSKCAKAYMNAKKRGSLDKLLAEPWTPPQPFDCEQCGKHCVPGENVAQHASKFCGKECKGEWHKTQEDGAHFRLMSQRRAERKRERARHRLANPEVIGKPRFFVEGRCIACGRSRFTASRGESSIAHYCSRTCQRRTVRSRRRARKRQAFVEEVWRPILFERDNWTCQLCGDPVDPDLKYPDPMCASVDHIVPLCAGGEHSYANTQLAHALCNSLKGDRESGSMMFAA